MARTTDDAAWLREQRARLGLTQHELGAALGHRNCWVSQVERGAADLPIAERLAVELLVRRTARVRKGARP